MRIAFCVARTLLDAIVFTVQVDHLVNKLTSIVVIESEREGGGYAETSSSLTRFVGFVGFIGVVCMPSRACLANIPKT